MLNVRADLYQGFSVLLLLTFWTGHFFTGGAAVCRIRCLAASLAFAHWTPEAAPSCGSKNSLQTLSDVPGGGGAKLPTVESP